MQPYFPKAIVYPFLSNSPDTLILTIEEQSVMRDNISVISNYFVFKADGEATGFSETMITSSNKGNLRDQFTALSDKLTVS